MLPGIDDGATNLDTALAMAKLAIADGITTTACTPHIYPGVYPNEGPAIRAAVNTFQQHVLDAGLALTLTTGADVHVDPDLVQGIKTGRVLTLADSRYILVEFPHRCTRRILENSLFALRAAELVPVVTHPERQQWIEPFYDTLVEFVRRGDTWVQITGGSLLGVFGKKARYWGERLLSEGYVHLLASDGHNIKRRPPVLSEAAHAAVRVVGDDEVRRLTLVRPQGILANTAVDQLPPAIWSTIGAKPTGLAGLWRRLTCSKN